MKIDKSSWTEVMLGDVVTKQEENDKANAKNRFDRFLKVEHLDAEKLHIENWGSQQKEELPPTFYKIFRKGQILFPTRNPHLRRAAIASFDGICGEKTLTLKQNTEIISPEFLPFLFHSDNFYAHTTSAIIGSTNPHVRWRDVANYKFFIPSKEKQKEVSELLWRTDKVLQAEENLLRRLKSILIVETENAIPDTSHECWKLGDVTTSRKGVTYKSSGYTDAKNGISLLNLKSIEIGGGFNKKGIKYYCGEHNDRHFVKNDDLIIACTDVTRNGNVVGFPLHPSVYQDKKMLFSMDLIAIEIIRDDLLRNYLYYVLKTRSAHRFLFSHSPGTTVLHLDTSGLNKLKIPKIDLNTQRKLVGKLEAIESSITDCELKISNTKILQKILINQFF